ncbi:SAF domain-containing protein [Candidatus Oscillochloris fontis]|uniref:SAF domain-containing protein n=1 Tax=Candidatus Oscillochloris fontis TaxID=2496868 RepID=UPI00101C10BC|nr:SAF domain-containing protein [Candidatus Oscillochloris fontis]
MSTATPVIPLTQALARKKNSPLPAILIVVGLIGAVTLAILGFLESRKSETLVVLVRDVPYGQQISAEDLGTVALPLHRPAQLVGVSNPAAVVGQYAARNLGTNDLLQPSMLMAAPPSQPVYPNGEQLNPDMVPVPFATTTIGPLTYRDRVNIGFNDPSGAPDLCDQARRAADGAPSIMPSPSGGMVRPYACRLLSSVRVLYVDDAAKIAYLELTPYQSHTIWALQAAGLQLWGERFGATSTPLAGLDRLDIGQVTLGDLEAAGIPGSSVEVPGRAKE